MSAVAAGRELRRLEENNRELWLRYRELQDAIIAAVDEGDWQAVQNIAHEQAGRQELERRRFE